MTYSNFCEFCGDSDLLRASRCGTENCPRTQIERLENLISANLKQITRIRENICEDANKCKLGFPRHCTGCGVYEEMSRLREQNWNAFARIKKLEEEAE